MTSSLCPKGPNSHARERCVLGNVVLFKPGRGPEAAVGTTMPRMLRGRTRPERTLAAKDARPPYCGSRAILRSRPRLSAALEASGGVFGDGEVEDKPVGDRGLGTRRWSFHLETDVGRAWLEAAFRGYRGLPRSLTVYRGCLGPLRLLLHVLSKVLRESVHAWARSIL